MRTQSDCKYNYFFSNFQIFLHKNAFFLSFFGFWGVLRAAEGGNVREMRRKKGRCEGCV
jgi:hypothetical protein